MNASNAAENLSSVKYGDLTMLQGTNPAKPVLHAGPRGSKIVRLTTAEVERFSMDDEYRFSLKLDVVDLAIELECTIEIVGPVGESLWLFGEATALAWKREGVR